MRANEDHDMSDALPRPELEGPAHPHGAAPGAAHGPPTGFWRRHVFSLDHKVIGRQYLDLALVAVTTGMILSWLMRIHLAWPTQAIAGLDKLSPNGAANGVISPEH